MYAPQEVRLNPRRRIGETRFTLTLYLSGEKALDIDIVLPNIVETQIFFSLHIIPEGKCIAINK